MGKFYTTHFTSTAISRITQLSDWFNAFDGITSEVVDVTVDNIQFTGAKVTIDGTDIEMYLGDRATAITNSYAYVALGSYKIASGRTAGGGNEAGIYAFAYISDDCIFLCADQNANGFEMLYTKTKDNKYLLGGTTNVRGDVAPQMSDVNVLTFIQVGDESHTPYKFADMFPYVATAGTIDFINEGFFVDTSSSRYKHFEAETLKACSTVTLRSTQSLPTGNCMALGAHCLAPLDDEEE